ncbi:MAG TPA: ATP-binding protein [Chloroflexia bacterium]|nr:ATP-binding protein [Chloroflexia bacterium]
MKEKLIATHLLVAASSAVATLAVLLLASAIFTPAAPAGMQITTGLALAAVAGFSGVAAAIVIARRLYQQLSVPLRGASAQARRLARGEYGEGESTPGLNATQNEGSAPSGSDDLDDLASALGDLSRSLGAAERRRTEAFDEITHELRTPIAILEGYFEGLLDGHVKPSDKTWAMLYDVASRAHRLVDELQTLSRAEARQEPPGLQAVDPGAMARAALDRLRLHFDEKGLELVGEIPKDLPRVLADTDHTIQVLVNLLTNALRYTPVPGKVTLSVNRLSGNAEPALPTGAGEVTFRVTDTGVGIAAEHIPHLFERFFRVDRSGSRSTGGSGIGLPVAKALVEAMGGRIWAESQGLGKGSTFYFTLLIAPHPPVV